MGLGDLESTPGVFRPMRRAERSPLVIALWGAFVVLDVLPRHGTERLLHAGLAVVSAVVTVVALRRWRNRAAIAVVGADLRRRGMFRTRTVARLPIRGRAVISDVIWSSGRRSGWWSLLDGDGRALLGLDLTAWEPADLSALAERLGVPEERDPELRDAADLRRAYPGTFLLVIAHPLRFALVCLAVGWLSALLLRFV